MEPVQQITAVLSVQLIDARRRRDADQLMMLKKRSNAKQNEQRTFAEMLASAMTE